MSVAFFETVVAAASSEKESVPSGWRLGRHPQEEQIPSILPASRPKSIWDTLAVPLTILLIAVSSYLLISFAIFARNVRAWYRRFRGVFKLGWKAFLFVGGLALQILKFVVRLLSSDERPVAPRRVGDEPAPDIGAANHGGRERSDKGGRSRSQEKEPMMVHGKEEEDNETVEHPSGQDFHRSRKHPKPSDLIGTVQRTT